jgi:hypothetical protein
MKGFLNMWYQWLDLII